MAATRNELWGLPPGGPTSPLGATGERRGDGSAGSQSPSAASPGDTPLQGNSEHGALQSLIAGAADAVSFGFADELSAHFGTLTGIGNYGALNPFWKNPKGYWDAYEQNLKAERLGMEEDRQDHFYAYTGGQLGGAVLIPYGSGARGALQVGTVGAVSGAAYGVGSGTDLKSRAEEAVKGGLFGGLFGAALGGVTSKLFGNKVADVAESVLDDAPLFPSGEAPIAGMAKGTTPIVRAPDIAEEAVDLIPLTISSGPREAGEELTSEVVGHIGRRELGELQDAVTKFSAQQADEGARAMDITWETAPDLTRDLGQWSLGTLGSEADSVSLLRALSETLPSKIARTDAELVASAGKIAADIGEDPDAVLMAAQEIAGKLGNVDSSMLALRTVWARQSQQVSELHLLGIDWATASDDLVEEAATRIHNLSLLSSSVQKAKTALGRGLRVNKLPTVDEYREALKEGIKQGAPAVGRLDPTTPLPTNRQQLQDWFELWGATGGDPRKQASLLQGLLTIPTGSKYLRQSFANFFTASILSAPRTLALNIAGPAVISSIRQAERLAGAAVVSINPLRSASQRAAARAVARHSATAYVKTFMEIGDAFRMAKIASEQNHTIIGGGGQTVDAVSSFGPFTDNLLEAAGREKTWQYTLGNLLNVFPRGMARLNNGLDEFSKRLAYQGEIRTGAMVEAAEKGLKGAEFQSYVLAKMQGAYDEIGHAADQQALRTAERVTLTAQVGEEGTWTRRIYNGIQALRSDYPEFRYILPILNVPANGLAETMRRLPIAGIPGVNNILFKQTARELAGELGPVLQADAHGRILLGAGFLMAGAQLNRMGILTGAGPKDPTDRKVWLATHQPYSIKLGGEWVRYDKFDILGGLLSIPATVMDASAYQPLDKDPMELWGAAVGSLAQWMRDRAALRTASGIFAAGDNPVRDAGDVISQTTGSIASGFYPAALRTIITDGVTNPYIPLRRSWLDYVEAAFPGNDVEVVRNVLGEPVDKPLNSVTEAFVPVNMVKAIGYDEDPTLDELDRLYQATGYGAGADTTAFSYGFFADKDVKLEDGRSLYTHAMQHRQTLEVGGKTLRQSLVELFNSKQYAEAVDADSQRKETSRGEPSRGYLVQKVFERYNKAIKAQMANDSPLAAAYMTAAAAKRSDDAYLRDVSVEELANNPALYDAKGVDRAGFEEDLKGGGGSTDALLKALGQ